MAVMESRLDHELVQLRNQRQRFVIRYALDGRAFAFRHVNGFTPGDRMRAKQRVPHQRHFLRASKRPM